VLSSNLRLLNPLRHPLFAWQLTSHKVCRWLVPFAMIAALVSGALLVARGVPEAEAATANPYVVLLGLQLGFYTGAAVGLATGSRALRLPAYFVVVNFAILAAWMRFAHGERMTTWTPSERLHALPRS
jgi:hydrogenase/urease accessory protein HupE